MKLNNLLIGSENPKALSEFYGKILGKKPEWTDSHYTGFDCGGLFITIGPHDKVHGKAKEPERILIGFEVNDVKGEFERIKALGAKVVAEPYDPMGGNDLAIATFEDADGNYFQLMRPWSEEDMKKAQEADLKGPKK
jgi:predicted enzyme related to lactoylglutathione lyase